MQIPAYAGQDQSLEVELFVFVTTLYDAQNLLGQQFKEEYDQKGGDKTTGSSDRPAAGSKTDPTFHYNEHI